MYYRLDQLLEVTIEVTIVTCILLKMYDDVIRRNIAKLFGKKCLCKSNIQVVFKM